MSPARPSIVNVSAKVRAFRETYSPDDYAIRTSFEVATLAGQESVIGHCKVIANKTGAVISEAFSSRALRPPVPGVQGDRDTRDIDRAQTQAVGRAMGLLGYADGESLEGDTDELDEPVDWFVTNGWRDQDHHDSFMADAKAAMKEVAATTSRDEMVNEWERRGLKWPLTYEQMTEWSKFLVPLARKTQAGARETGDRAESEPVSQPSLDDVVGPDAPLVKR